MITLLRVTVFNAGFWIGAVTGTLAVVGYLYYMGSTLIWVGGKKK